MNQGNRGRELGDEIRTALEGEQPRPRARGDHASSGNHGVSVAGSGNQVHYYSGPPGWPGSPGRIWIRVWLGFSVLIFLVGVWMQTDLAAWHATAGEPGAVRLYHTLQGTPQDLIVPIAVGFTLGGIVTLFLKRFMTRR